MFGRIGDRAGDSRLLAVFPSCFVVSGASSLCQSSCPPEESVSFPAASWALWEKASLTVVNIHERWNLLFLRLHGRKIFHRMYDFMWHSGITYCFTPQPFENFMKIH